LQVLPAGRTAEARAQGLKEEYWESTSETMIQRALTRVLPKRLEGTTLTPAAVTQLAI
jgi:hypothetical protein